jgi:hypothetical protein
LNNQKIFRFTDVNKIEQELLLNKDSLCFTYCQVPVIYQLSDTEGLEVVYNDGKHVTSNIMSLDESISKSLFDRTGEVNKVVVSLKK